MAMGGTHPMMTIDLTLQARIARAADEVAVAFSSRSASPYVSIMLSADSDVLAVALAAESLHITQARLHTLQESVSQNLLTEQPLRLFQIKNTYAQALQQCGPHPWTSCRRAAMSSSFRAPATGRPKTLFNCSAAVTPRACSVSR